MKSEPRIALPSFVLLRRDSHSGSGKFNPELLRLQGLLFFFTQQVPQTFNSFTLSKTIFIIAITGIERNIPEMPQSSSPTTKPNNAIKELICTLEPTTLGMMKLLSIRCITTMAKITKLNNTWELEEVANVMRQVSKAESISFSSTWTIL